MASNWDTSSCTVKFESGRTFASVVELELSDASARSTAVDVRVDAVVTKRVAPLTAAEGVHVVAGDADTGVGVRKDGVLLAGHTVVDQLAST